MVLGRTAGGRRRGRAAWVTEMGCKDNRLRDIISVVVTEKGGNVEATRAHGG
jgi:hypothetical protein